MAGDDPRILLQSALEKARTDDYPGARDELESLIAAVPDFPDAHYYHGLVCGRLGDEETARTSLSRCLELDPFHDQATQQLRALGNEPSPETDTAVEANDEPGPITEDVFVRPAGFWIRAVALFIDGLLLFPVSRLVGLFLTSPFAETISEIQEMDTEEIFELVLGNDIEFLRTILVIDLLQISSLLLVSLVFIGSLNYLSGQTLGKRILGIRIVTADSLDYLSLAQSLGRVIASFLSLCICFVGFVVAGVTPEKRALHDYIAGTRVVYSERVPITIGEVILISMLVLFALISVVVGFLDLIVTIEII